MTGQAGGGGLLRRKGPDVVISIILAVATASSAPFWWQYLPFAKKHAPTPASGVIRFTGGCEPYQIFAQNRWQPYGAAVRTEPNVLSKEVGDYSGNHSLSVDGWVHGAVAYPTNTPPWNSDVWFHLADGSGWVGFAGVRAVPTPQDPTGLSPDGGQPAPAPSNCQGQAQ
jgi:hypothetical protein